MGFKEKIKAQIKENNKLLSKLGENKMKACDIFTESGAVATNAKLAWLGGGAVGAGMVGGIGVWG